MGRRRISCHACAAIKTICSKDSPCSRCNRLSLPCSLEVGDQDTGAAVKRRHPRTTTGCSACRHRRKKCDEQKPACGDCQRLRLECHFRQRRRPSSSEIGILDDLGYSGQLRSRRSSESSRASDPGTSSLQEAPVEWIALLEDGGPTQLSRTVNLAHSPALVDLPVPCTRQDEASMSTFYPPLALSCIVGLDSDALANWSLGERYLLNHYLQSVSRALVVVDDGENPWLRIITQTALKSPTVRHALLALSASHLAKIYPVFHHDLAAQRSRALGGLKTELHDKKGNPTALMTIMLLCLTEICDGLSKRWLIHLRGAHALLLEADSVVAETAFHVLTDLYNLISCMGSITCQGVPDFFEPRPEPRIGHLTQQSTHPLFGMSADLYRLLHHMNKLFAMRESHSEETPPEDFETEIRAVQLKLQNWSPAESIEARPQFMAEARAAAVALQWAAMIWLYQKTGRPENFQTKTASDNILSALSLVKPGSQAESRCLFPLFMAGVVCNSKASRLTIEYRLSTMEASLGLGNIMAAHKLLDEVWRRANGSEVVNWEELAKTRYPGLVLF